MPKKICRGQSFRKKAIMYCKMHGLIKNDLNKRNNDLWNLMVNHIGEEKAAEVIGVKIPKPTAKAVRSVKHSVKRTSGAEFYASDEWRAVRYEALRIHGARCQCCGATRADGVRLHVDHIKPRSKYPRLELEITNLQILCEDCNLGKMARDDTDWRHMEPGRKDFDSLTSEFIRKMCDDDA